MTTEPVEADLSHRDPDAGDPTWSVLVAHLARREGQLARLLVDLGPQVAAAAGRVEVVIYRNRGERPLAEIRQALVDDARGAYVSFVDDDDRVPDYFVPRVLEQLDRDVDYVGWRMQAFVDGRALKPTYHTLESKGWSEDERGYYRDTSHLNPVRTTLARECDFRKTNPPEDVSWSDQLREVLRKDGRTPTQGYVEDVMYLYYSSSADSAWRPGHEAFDLTSPPVEVVARWVETLPYVRLHRESS